MKNVRVGASKKTIVILSLLFLIIGGAGGYLLWRVNQQETVAPVESEAGGDQTGECRENCYPEDPSCGTWEEVKAQLDSWNQKPFYRNPVGQQAAHKSQSNSTYSKESVFTIPTGVKGELVLYYASLDGIMHASFGLGGKDFLMNNLDSQGRQKRETGISVGGGETFYISSFVSNGFQEWAKKPGNRVCPPGNDNKYQSLGWVEPQGNVCGTGFWGPPQNGRCCRYAKPDVASEIAWAQNDDSRNTIVSKQCWADWLEWIGDYDFNDYFLIIAVRQQDPENPLLSVNKEVTQQCDSGNQSATLTYTVTVENYGSATGYIKKVVDKANPQFPNAPTNISPSNGSYSNGTLTWNFESENGGKGLAVEAGVKKVFTYKVKIPKEKFEILYNNSVTVTQHDGPDLSAEADITCHCDNPAPVLTITKTGAPKCIGDGTQTPTVEIAYTISVKNTQNAGQFKRIVDTLDGKVVSYAGVEVTGISSPGKYRNGKITWEGPFNIGEGETKTFTYYTVKIPTDKVPPKDQKERYINKAILIPMVGESKEAEAKVDIGCDRIAPASLTVEKKGTPECIDNNTDHPTALLSYTITIENKPGVDTGRVKKVEDVLDTKILYGEWIENIQGPDGPNDGQFENGKIVWSYEQEGGDDEKGREIPAGGKLTYTYQVRIPTEHLKSGVIYKNTVWVTDGNDNIIRTDATVEPDCIELMPADLILRKTGVSKCVVDDPANPYAILEYEIKLQNNGEADGEIAKVVDTLDQNAATMSAPYDITPDGGVYDEATRTITWTFDPPLVLKGTADPDATPEDRVQIFTYKLKVNKENFGVYKNNVVVTKGDGTTLERGFEIYCTCMTCGDGNLDPGETCEAGDPEDASCPWSQCDQQTCQCIPPEKPPVQPRTGLFNNSKNIVIMGTALLLTGLGWRWISKTYLLVNGKLVQRKKMYEQKTKERRKKKFEEKVVKK